MLRHFKAYQPHSAHTWFVNATTISGAKYEAKINPKTDKAIAVKNQLSKGELFSLISMDQIIKNEQLIF